MSTQEEGKSEEDNADAVSEDAAMRMAARALGRARGAGKRSGGGKRRRRLSDSRDPQPVGGVVDELFAEQGWQGTAALASLTQSWPQIVGADVAEHLTVESWADGEVVLRADSTAWATQMRLLGDQLREQIQQAVGPELIKSVKVVGPSAPSWRAGPRVVKGRGPRDTYG